MAPKKRTTRASPATTTTTPTPVTNAQLKALIDQGVVDALAARDANRSMNGDDSHNSGTGVRRQAPLARECTYLDFMKCKPLFFKGTKGVFELTQWFERMETVFHISNCTVENQIMFATCTLLGSTLTWWNAHVRTVGHDVVYAMNWTNLKKMMTDKYCPKGKIKKLMVEMWNLKVKGTDVVGYNQRFQELALMCARMFPEDSDKLEKYVGGLPDMVHGSVMASKPKTMQDAIEFATELMDKKINTFAERQAENKRKLDNNNQAQQQSPKKQVLSDKPIKQMLIRPEKTGHIAKWAIELGEHKIEKGPESENAWKLFTDEASSSDGSRAGLMLVDPEGKEYTYTLRLFEQATSHKAIPRKAKELLVSFPTYSIEHIKRDQNKKADALSKLASMIFSKLAKEVLVEVLQEKSITQKEVINVTQEEEDNWMIPIREFLQLRKLLDDPQKPRKLREQHKPRTSSKRSVKLAKLISGTKKTKARNDIYNVSVAFLTMGIDIIGPLLREPGGAREDLDILEERREIASIKEAHYKQKLERYYNKRVRSSTFNPGTYVLRLNSASKAEFQRKMGPTWEGSYVVKKAYGDGAYKLETLFGSSIDRTRNRSNLRKFYV
ncbi:reverse transcriptase domain-containing protein [Tanacetum coccineum]|uniref:Reverse transcriptase domain-containing protein n=1 Tax=Tanacetum coccineum TaxID=301880 RepID=A0ABQ5CFI2_9ASTR